MPGGALRALLGRLRRSVRGRSLRVRLVVGLVLVAALGLTTADLVVYNEIEPYLIRQVDQQLVSAMGPLQRVVIAGEQAPPGVPVGTFAMVYSGSGVLVAPPRCVVPSGASCPKAAPKLPVWYLRSLPNQSSHVEHAISVPATGAGVPGYRVASEPVFDGFFLVVAIPLSDVHNTLTHLLVIEVAVSLAVMAALLALGYAVVRLGLKPLEEIEETAGAIAAGDLSRRVEVGRPSTEIGRLSTSLNGMLAQIENAFEEQKASEDRLRQFLADASHELRTPVTSIRGYSELFRRGAASRPEDLALAMRRIEDEAARMGVLVDDLLLLARLDQGRPLEREPVDLGVLATEVAADAAVLEPERPISVQVSDGVIVLGDAQRLRQIVANLVHNALRHTPVEAAIEVRVERRAGRAVLTVADRGPGIPAEHAEHVFERFYRADPSRTRGSGGSGLGLSIVASLAEAHGGSARLDTKVGGGPSFTVELPLLEELPQAPAQAARPDAETGAPRSTEDHGASAADAAAARRARSL